MGYNLTLNKAQNPVPVTQATNISIEGNYTINPDKSILFGAASVYFDLGTEHKTLIIPQSTLSTSSTTSLVSDIEAQIQANATL